MTSVNFLLCAKYSAAWKYNSHEISVALQRAVMTVNMNVFVILFALQYKKSLLYEF
jgi:hypothetical protein